jgi:hypothetical protein
MVAGAFLLVSINYLLDPHLYRNILQKSLTTLLEREVSIGKAKIYLGSVAENFQVRIILLIFFSLLICGQTFLLKGNQMK